MRYDVAIIGGGPAGLAAACAAWDRGCRSICLIERDRCLGGILNQCIHNGFGLDYFKEELTGPEYAERFIDLLARTGVEVRTDTMVLELGRDRTLRLLSPQRGYEQVEAGAVVLAMGCRERTRGAIATPGTRPAGVFTAGAAQRYLNMEGYLVGRRVVILGSGDIGLIMARRMTLAGAEVLACVELQPYSGGLTRNIVQCLEDFDIPLYLSHTVTEIRGRRRVEQVVVARVDEDRRPIPGTELVFDCDTLLLSVGLIPENELSRAAGIPMDSRTGGPVVDQRMETAIPGVFACGNVLHVHDLVDCVTREAQLAGAAAAAFAAGETAAGEQVELEAGPGIGCVVPQRVTRGEAARLLLRVRQPMGQSALVLTDGAGNRLKTWKRLRMAPGETEELELPAALTASADRLTLLAEEAEA